jgi:hypothetical protein
VPTDACQCQPAMCELRGREVDHALAKRLDLRDIGMRMQGRGSNLV